MNLNSTFRKISKAFAAEFDELTREISHNLTSGEARERVLITLLKKYLPSRMGIDSGFVIDALGGESKQIDVVIYDKTVGTIFEVAEVKFFPCESVIAVGEVKSDIASSEKLADALEKISSVKALDRSNRKKNELITGPGISIPGIAFDPELFHRDQILGFIFTSGSLSQDNLISQIQAYLKSHEPKVWPNLYCDWHRHIISYETTSNALSPAPMEAKYLYCTEESETPDLLLLFYCILADFIGKAHVARPIYFDYAAIKETKAVFYGLFEGGGERADGTKI